MEVGFRGFLSTAKVNGDIVLTGYQTDEFHSCSGVLWFFVKKFNRDALWIPNPFAVIRIIKEKEIRDVHIVGEPTYFTLGVIMFIDRVFSLKLNVSTRVAQNVEYPLPYFPFRIWMREFAKSGVSFAVSHLSMEFAKKFYGISKLAVLPNGVPDEFYQDTCLKGGNRDLILYVGTHLKRKGYLEFAELAESSNIEGYKWLMVGGTRMQCDWINKSFTRVKAIPKVNRYELISFYKNAQVVVMPSLSTDGSDVKGFMRTIKIPWMEQFGRVIIEAYSQGTPVVAYKCGAIPEVLISQDDSCEEGNRKDLEYLIKKKLHFNEYSELVDYSKQFKWSEVYSKFLRERKFLFSKG